MNIRRKWLSVANRGHGNAKPWLATAISLGVLLMAGATWVSLHLSEWNPSSVELVTGVLAALIVIIWLRRVKIFGRMAERVLFFYSLCKALALLILALLLISWGFGWFMPPIWEWTGISLAEIFFLTSYGLLIYRRLISRDPARIK